MGISRLKVRELRTSQSVLSNEGSKHPQGCLVLSSLVQLSACICKNTCGQCTYSSGFLSMYARSSIVLDPDAGTWSGDRPKTTAWPWAMIVVAPSLVRDHELNSFDFMLSDKGKQCFAWSMPSRMTDTWLTGTSPVAWVRDVALWHQYCWRSWYWRVKWRLYIIIWHILPGPRPSLRLWGGDEHTEHTFHGDSMLGSGGGAGCSRGICRQIHFGNMVWKSQV